MYLHYIVCSIHTVPTFLGSKTSVLALVITGLICENSSCYGPINVMPHYHIHGLRWGKVGICTLGKYKSQSTGAAVLV